MEPPEHSRSQRPESGRCGAERQEALGGLPTIALDEEEASRFLEALERPDDGTVAKLADLRRRA